MYSICIAEDEYYVQKSLEARIIAFSYDIEIKGFASNGDEALELYYKYSPDIFLVDINMPDKDGFQFIKEAKEDPNNKTKFIIISGYSDFKFMRQAIQFSVFDYIQKPIVTEEFEEILKKAIDLLNKEKSENLLSCKEDIYCDEFKESLSGEVLNGTILLVYSCQNNNFINSYEAADLYLNLKKISNLERILFKDEKSLSLFYFSNKYIMNEKLVKVSKNFNRKNEGIFISQYLNQDNFEQVMHNIECTLNLRFFRRCEYICINTNQEKKYKVENLEILNYAVEHGNTEILHKQICSRMDEIYKTQNTVQLNAYYQQVILFIINQYNKNDLHVPENVNRGMLPFALVKYTYQQITNSLCSMGEKLIEDINKIKKTKDLSTEICIYLQNHFNENISLNDLAKQFYISPSYLSHYFKKKENMTVVKYLEYIRLIKAKEYLEKTQMPITDVAEQVGYYDNNYFAKVFRKEFKISPSDYRKQILF
ncbi:helix-turn-helix domain-containing protein [Anaerocolumna sedimenticola]|uniref:Stage 0 sporulation protein A homolog n=1 Tax=Anaerocolumna sedimenticola TaxID=2696063 RepID=A0A6P1TQ89_9FIRM|nr:helix-turn-helix domain-containing protein [Anaerocolumna sedimenticola]QHQ63134.1 helix-turn-helix domain-containing protein [Anaerocolumna sedimenticola]